MKGITVNQVTKTFGTTKALDNVTLTFEENKVYGLLGRNGAGKSTLLNVIANRVFADSGHVVIDGLEAKENDKALAKLYLMSENNYYPDRLRVMEGFRWSKEFYPEFDLDYAMSLSKKFSLDTKKKIKSLSTGYLSIFKVITALAANTSYIFLDEPVLGLDANHRDLFYQILIEKYSHFPCGIIISTHLIEEVSNVIEDVVIIKEGKIIRNESKDDLLSKGYSVTGKIESIDAYTAGKEVLSSNTIGGLKTVSILGLCDRRMIPVDIEVSALDLQSLFIQLTNI